LGSLRAATAEEPLRILMSACLVGLPCGVDGSDYSLGRTMAAIVALPTAHIIPFCPEHHGLGTPRTMPDIHDGDGFDVLDGRARVLDERGADLTEGMLKGARRMLEHTRLHRAEIAILTDMSAACGSQVISLGCRLVEKRRFTASVGVATALLLRNGFHVVAQRDHESIGRLRAHLDPGFTPDPAAIDYHQCDWYRGQFNTPG
jgi:uncharacterized protein YbbK (DUF523 family)